jgi:hypothetical protein
VITVSSLFATLYNLSVGDVVHVRRVHDFVVRLTSVVLVPLSHHFGILSIKSNNIRYSIFDIQ